MSKIDYDLGHTFLRVLRFIFIFHKSQLTVGNGLGQVVTKSIIASSSYRTELNLTGLPGIYLYKINLNDQTLQSGKLVIR